MPFTDDNRLTLLIHFCSQRSPNEPVGDYSGSFGIDLAVRTVCAVVEVSVICGAGYHPARNVFPANIAKLLVSQEGEKFPVIRKRGVTTGICCLKRSINAVRS